MWGSHENRERQASRANAPLKDYCSSSFSLERSPDPHNGSPDPAWGCPASALWALFLLCSTRITLPQILLGAESAASPQRLPVLVAATPSAAGAFTPMFARSHLFTSFQLLPRFYPDSATHRLCPAFPTFMDGDSSAPWPCSASSCFHITWDLTWCRIYPPVLPAASLSPPVEGKLAHSWCSVNICWMNIIFYTSKAMFIIAN